MRFWRKSQWDSIIHEAQGIWATNQSSDKIFTCFFSGNSQICSKNDTSVSLQWLTNYILTCYSELGFNLHIYFRAIFQWFKVSSISQTPPLHRDGLLHNKEQSENGKLSKVLRRRLKVALMITAFGYFCKKRDIFNVNTMQCCIQNSFAHPFFKL